MMHLRIMLALHGGLLYATEAVKLLFRV